MSAVRIIQTRSVSGRNARQRATLRSLGLGRVGKSAEHTETPQIRGMLRAVAHLIAVEERSG